MKKESIYCAVFLGLTILIIVASVELGVYDEQFLPDLMIHLHATLFEICVISVILYYLNKHYTKKADICRYEEGIELLRGYISVETTEL